MATKKGIPSIFAGIWGIGLEKAPEINLESIQRGRETDVEQAEPVEEPVSPTEWIETIERPLPEEEISPQQNWWVTSDDQARLL